MANRRRHGIRESIIRPTTSENLLVFFLGTAIAGFFFGLGLNAAAKLEDKLASTKPGALLTPAGTRLSDYARSWARLARAREATLDEQQYNAYRAGRAYRSGWSYN